MLVFSGWWVVGSGQPLVLSFDWSPGGAEDCSQGREPLAEGDELYRSPGGATESLRLFPRMVSPRWGSLFQIVTNRGLTPPAT
jgi:hypothetical protein